MYGKEVGFLKRIKARRNRPKKSSGPIINLLLGIGISWAAAVILALLCAKLIVGGQIPESGQTAATAVLWAVSAAVGSFATAKGSASQKLPLGMGSAAATLVLAAAGHALLISGEYRNILPISLAVLLGGLAGSLAGARGKRRKYG